MHFLSKVFNSLTKSHAAHTHACTHKSSYTHTGSHTHMHRLKLGSQYAAQLRDAAKRVMQHWVCRKFRLRIYPRNAATCTVSALLRR